MPLTQFSRSLLKMFLKVLKGVISYEEKIWIFFLFIFYVLPLIFKLDSFRKILLYNNHIMLIFQCLAKVKCSMIISPFVLNRALIVSAIRFVRFLKNRQNKFHKSQNGILKKKVFCRCSISALIQLN